MNDTVPAGEEEAELGGGSRERNEKAAEEGENDGKFCEFSPVKNFAKCVFWFIIMNYGNQRHCFMLSVRMKDDIDLIKM